MHCDRVKSLKNFRFDFAGDVWHFDITAVEAAQTHVHNQHAIISHRGVLALQDFHVAARQVTAYYRETLTASQ